MASGSEIDDSEITATNNMFSAIVTLTSLPLPTLPIDVIIEILCRLPVKLLLQLRCVCKSWNYLISDSEFIKKKHLHMSTTRHVFFIKYRGYRYPQNTYTLKSYRVNSVFNNLTTDFTLVVYSPNSFINGDYPQCGVEHFVGSCNGILCFADTDKGLVILWNPSIRKFKELPLFTVPNVNRCIRKTYGFGYDSSTDKYKVVVILDYYSTTSEIAGVRDIEVQVHTLGTNTWRTIQGYPSDGVPDWSAGSGKFVSGTINWLLYKDNCSENFIVSFDLVNESFQMILPRIGGVDIYDMCYMGVLRDCLCVTCGNDVWIMEEYRNKESWTKLFTVPYVQEPDNPPIAIMPIYIFDDNQVIIYFNGGRSSDLDLALYDSKSGILKPTDFKNIPEVCIGSLISPCSLCYA